METKRESDRESPKNKKLIVKSIFMTHVRRIGWIRTALGGGLMYLSVLEFIFIHLTSIVFLYQWLLTPFFKVRKFAVRDYILLDRGKIAGMWLFDRFNCEFCGYANGTAKLWNDQIDAIAAADLGKGKLIRKFVAGLFSFCLCVFLFFSFIFSKILFLVISLFLGMHWANNRELYRKLVAENYAGHYNPFARALFRFAKLYAATLAYNLEQIESSWCPLKHIETSTTVVSDHHANFYDRERVAEVIEVLEKEGTVSPRKPRY